MTYNLPTTTAPGASGHTALHNQTAAAVNDLDSRVDLIEGNSANSVWLPASAFTITSGSPILTSAAPVARSRWLLDSGTTEIVAVEIMPPLGWTTAKGRIYWSSESTQAGNAMIQFRALPPKVSGDVLNSGEGTQSLTLDAPDQSVLAINEYPNTINVTTADPANRPVIQLSIRRIGADAADTFPADISFLGLALVKAS